MVSCSLNICIIMWRGNHTLISKCFSFHEDIDPSPISPRLTLLSPGFTLQKWIGLCRLVFSTLHSLFTVMLLWFCNGLRANERPAAGSVLLRMCSHALFVCLSAWVFHMHICLSVSVCVDIFFPLSLLDLTPSSWIVLFSKREELSSLELLLHSLSERQDLDYFLFRCCLILLWGKLCSQSTPQKCSWCWMKAPTNS